VHTTSNKEIMPEQESKREAPMSRSPEIKEWAMPWELQRG